MNILDFAGQHPWVALFSLMILTHMPVAIIRALKNKKDFDD